MPRCHTDGEAGFSWLAFAPSLSFPVSRPPHGFSSHPIPLHRTAGFFFSFNTNFPFQPPTFRAVSHAGPAQWHGVGVSGPRSSPRFQKSGTHSPLTSSDRPGPALLLHPAGSFPLPPLAAPAHPGRPDPSPSSRGGNSGDASSLSLPRISRILCPVRAGGAARDGVQRRAPLRGPSTDLSPARVPGALAGVPAQFESPFLPTTSTSLLS